VYAIAAVKSMGRMNTVEGQAARVRSEFSFALDLRDVLAALSPRWRADAARIVTPGNAQPSMCAWKRYSVDHDYTPIALRYQSRNLYCGIILR
jgi:hypothetical protein